MLPILLTLSPACTMATRDSDKCHTGSGRFVDGRPEYYPVVTPTSCTYPCYVIFVLISGQLEVRYDCHRAASTFDYQQCKPYSAEHKGAPCFHCSEFDCNDPANVADVYDPRATTDAVAAGTCYQGASAFDGRNETFTAGPAPVKCQSTTCLTLYTRSPDGGVYSAQYLCAGYDYANCKEFGEHWERSDENLFATYDCDQCTGDNCNRPGRIADLLGVDAVKRREEDVWETELYEAVTLTGGGSTTDSALCAICSAYVAVRLR